MIESITKEVAEVDLKNAILKETYPVLEKNGDYTMYVLVEYDKNKAVEEEVAQVFERKRERRLRRVQGPAGSRET